MSFFGELRSPRDVRLGFYERCLAVVASGGYLYRRGEQAVLVNLG